MDDLSPSTNAMGCPGQSLIMLEGLTGCIAPFSYMLYILQEKDRVLLFHRDDRRSKDTPFMLKEMDEQEYLALWKSVMKMDPLSLADNYDNIGSTAGFRGTLVILFTAGLDIKRKSICISGDSFDDKRVEGLLKILTDFATAHLSLQAERKDALFSYLQGENR